MLSGELVEATRNAAPEDTSLLLKSKAKIETFRDYAVGRTVALRELLPLYDDHPDAHAALSAELDAQSAMVSEYDENIRQIEEKGQQE